LASNEEGEKSVILRAKKKRAALSERDRMKNECREEGGKKKKDSAGVVKKKKTDHARCR